MRHFPPLFDNAVRLHVEGDGPIQVLDDVGSLICLVTLGSAWRMIFQLEYPLQHTKFSYDQSFGSVPFGLKLRSESPGGCRQCNDLTMDDESIGRPSRLGRRGSGMMQDNIQNIDGSGEKSWSL